MKTIEELKALRLHSHGGYSPSRRVSRRWSMRVYWSRTGRQAKRRSGTESRFASPSRC